MSRLYRASRQLAATALAVGLAALPAAALHVDKSADAPAFDTDPSWRKAETVADLVQVLEDWLDTATALPRRAEAPAIRIVSPEDARSRSGAPARGHGRIRGLYDAGASTIFLVAPWSADDAGDVSVLLHELVHHRQAPLHWYCTAAQEPAAYAAQAAWLSDRGRSLDWPRLAVTLAAGCTPVDIHPE